MRHAESLVLAVGSQGEEVVLGRSSGGGLWRWDRHSGRLLAPFKRSRLLDVDGFARFPTASAAVGASMVVCTDSSRGGLQFWDAKTGSVLGRPIADGQMQTWALATAPRTDADANALVFVSGGSDGLIHLWDPSTGDEVGRPISGCGQAVGLAVLPGDSGRCVIAVINTEGIVHRVDLTSGVRLGPGLDTGWQPPQYGQPHRCRGWIAAVTGDDGTGLLAACAGPTQPIRLWDADDPSMVVEVDRARHRIAAVRAVAAGRLADGRPIVLVGDANGNIHHLHARTGEPIDTPIAPHGTRPWTAALVTQDGHGEVLAVVADDRVYRFDAHRGTPVGDPLQPWTPGAVHGIATARLDDGRDLIVAATDDGVARFDPTSGQALPRHRDEHATTIWDLAVLQLPDARVVGGGHDGRLYQWDAATGRAIGEPLAGHATSIKAVASFMTNDGTPLIVSGCEAGEVRCWNAVTGSCVAGPFQVATGMVTSLAVVESRRIGPILMCGDDAGFMHRWNLTEGEPLGESIAAPVWPRILSATPDVDGFVQALIWHVDHGGDPGVEAWRIDDGCRIATPDFHDDTIAMIRRADSMVDVAGSSSGAVTITPVKWPMDDRHNPQA
jgi:WD40 repeat protein